MIKSWTFARYTGFQYLFWFVVFLTGLAGIIFLFEVAELLRRSANLPDAGFTLVVRMGLYKLPETIERILPFVVLFAGMFTFWRLTRSQELIVARAAGVSAWQFLAPALFITLLFGFFNVTLINPIGASLNAKYHDLDQRYLQRTPTLELTGAGLWLRQQDNDNRYLLHADHIGNNPLTLLPLMLLVYDKDGHYLGRIDAPQATLDNGFWDIRDAWLNWDQKTPEHVDSYHLNTSLTLDKIQESMAAPNTISFWELPNFIRALKSIGLPPTRHELQFQSLMSQPVLLCAMVFFCCVIFAAHEPSRGRDADHSGRYCYRQYRVYTE